jgi:hypothetical protein
MTGIKKKNVPPNKMRSREPFIWEKRYLPIIKNIIAAEATREI